MMRAVNSLKKSEVPIDFSYATKNQCTRRISAAIRIIDFIGSRDLPKNNPFSYHVWTDARLPKIFADKVFKEKQKGIYATRFV